MNFTLSIPIFCHRDILRTHNFQSVIIFDVSKMMQNHISSVFFLLNFCHYSLGMIYTDALSKDNDRGTSVESQVLSMLRLRFVSEPFLHILMMRLTSGQPLRQGSLMIFEKQFQRPTLRFSMSSGLLLVFVQKCVLGKGGNSAWGMSNFSKVSWTAFSSLKRYLQTQTSLLVRSLRCISQSTTPSSTTYVGMRRRQNLSDLLKSQSPSTSLFRLSISVFIITTFPKLSVLPRPLRANFTN